LAKIADASQNVRRPSTGFSVPSRQELKAVPRLPNLVRWYGNFTTHSGHSRIRRQIREENVTSHPARSSSRRLQSLSTLNDGCRQEKVGDEKQVSDYPAINPVVKEQKAGCTGAVDALDHRPVGRICNLRSERVALGFQLKGFFAGVAAEVHYPRANGGWGEGITFAGWTVQLFLNPALRHDSGDLGLTCVPGRQSRIEPKVHSDANVRGDLGSCGEEPQARGTMCETTQVDKTILGRLILENKGPESTPRWRTVVIAPQ